MQRDLNDPDSHDGVITHLDPGILECKVKRVLGSITMNKASGGGGIPVGLFQISERDGNTRPHNLPLEKSVCRSGSNS